MKRLMTKIEAIEIAQGAHDMQKNEYGWIVGRWTNSGIDCGNNNGLDYASALQIYCQEVAQSALTLMYGIDESYSENIPNIELNGDECGSVRQRIRQVEKRVDRMRAKG